MTSVEAHTRSGESHIERDEKDRTSFEYDCLVHLDVLYRFAFGLTADAMRAEDLVQETMLKAYGSWNRFQGTNVRGWLLTILRNTLYSEFRTERRRGVMVDFDVVESWGHLPSPAADPENKFFESIVEVDVRAVLDRLPLHFRETFLLNLEGLDYREVADTLDIPVGTVRSRIHRARSFLRSELLSYAVREGFIRKPTTTAASC